MAATRAYEQSLPSVIEDIDEDESIIMDHVVYVAETPEPQTDSDKADEIRMKIKTLRLSHLFDIESGMAECILLVRLLREQKVEVHNAILEAIRSHILSITYMLNQQVH